MCAATSQVFPLILNKPTKGAKYLQKNRKRFIQYGHIGRKDRQILSLPQASLLGIMGMWPLAQFVLWDRQEIDDLGETINQSIEKPEG